jgi:hypothetical protein
VRRPIPFLLLCFILAACGPSLPYANDYPLTGEQFTSRAIEFSGKVPEGWFAAPLDSLPAMYKLWLVKEGYAATLHIAELKLDALSEKEVHSKGLRLLAEISLSFHGESGHPPEVIAPPKEFKILGKEYCGFELKEQGTRKRVIVFSAQGRFYESVASTNGGSVPAQNLTQLFSTQQTLLSSLVFR